MSAVQVIVRSEGGRSLQSVATLLAYFDVPVDGANLTARVGAGQSSTLLVDLGQAMAALATRKSRLSVPLGLGEEPWELGLEADAGDILLSVYRTGACPTVAAFERRVPFDELRAAVLAALRQVREMAPGALDSALTAAERSLESAAAPGAQSPRRLIPEDFGTEPNAVFRLTGRGEFRRAPSRHNSDPQLERADLHSLLLTGALTLEVSERRTVFPNTQLYLFAEKLLLLAEEVLSAWQAGRALFRRTELDGLELSLRLAPGAAHVSLTFRAPATSGRVTFPEIPCTAFVGTAVDYGQKLARAFIRHDRSQEKNLRLGSFLATVRVLQERLEEAVADDAWTNPAPESYRLFGVPKARVEHVGSWSSGGKMKFLPRWVATVPGIDLRATFLCGDRLIVASTRETACLDRRQGDVLWRAPTLRAASAATPQGLARIHHDGRIQLLDLDSGEVRYTVRLAPRSGGGASGALVHAPGLPKLLVVAEGERQITAVELSTGEIRWRHTGRSRASYRLRRAGKLLLVAGGDSALLALDVQTGEIVWRARSRIGFSGDMVVDHDAAFAISGMLGSSSRLHHFNLWSGEGRWVRALSDRPLAGQAPLVTPNQVVLVTRDPRGEGLLGLDRSTGETVWERAPGFASAGTAWLAVDQLVVGNSPVGTLVATDAATGELRFNHVFPRPSPGDQPRCLEPILRSGALFVPQQQVHVVRPLDGDIIGSVPSDLIPDLLRVDERCDVYLAEESGHLAAFGAGPRLTLVRGAGQAAKPGAELGGSEPAF